MALRHATGEGYADDTRVTSLEIVVDEATLVDGVVCNLATAGARTGHVPQHHNLRGTIQPAYRPAAGERLQPETHLPPFVDAATGEVAMAAAADQPAAPPNASYQRGDKSASMFPLDHSVILPSFAVLLADDAALPLRLLDLLTAPTVEAALTTLRAVVATAEFQEDFARVRALLGDDDFDEWCAMYLARLLLSTAMARFVLEDVAGMGDAHHLPGVGTARDFPPAFRRPAFDQVLCHGRLDPAYCFAFNPFPCLVRAHGARVQPVAVTPVQQMLQSMAAAARLLTSDRTHEASVFRQTLFQAGGLLTPGSPVLQAQFAPLRAPQCASDVVAARHAVSVHAALRMLSAEQARLLNHVFGRRELQHVFHRYPSRQADAAFARVQAMALVPAVQTVAVTQVVGDHSTAAPVARRRRPATTTRVVPAPLTGRPPVAAKEACCTSALQQLLRDMHERMRRARRNVFYGTRARSRRAGPALVLERGVSLCALDSVCTDDARVDAALVQCAFGPLLVFCRALLTPPAGSVGSAPLLEVDPLCGRVAVSDHVPVRLADWVAQARRTARDAFDDVLRADALTMVPAQHVHQAHQRVRRLSEALVRSPGMVRMARHRKRKREATDEDGGRAPKRRPARASWRTHLQHYSRLMRAVVGDALRRRAALPYRDLRRVHAQGEMVFVLPQPAWAPPVLARERSASPPAPRMAPHVWTH